MYIRGSSPRATEISKLEIYSSVSRASPIVFNILQYPTRPARATRYSAGSTRMPARQSVDRISQDCPFASSQWAELFKDLQQKFSKVFKEETGTSGENMSVKTAHDEYQKGSVKLVITYQTVRIKGSGTYLFQPRVDISNLLNKERPATQGKRTKFCSKRASTWFQHQQSHPES